MLTYRRATIKDTTQIAMLMIKLHKDLLLEEAIKKEINFFTEKKAYFIALNADKVVGYVFGEMRTDYVEGSEQYIDPKAGYIESLYVLPAYRKQGAARRLCGMVEEWAKSKGATEIASDAYAANKTSRAFHRAIGFTESKPIVHFIKKI